MRFFSFRNFLGGAALCGVLLSGCSRENAENVAAQAARDALRLKLKNKDKGGKIGAVVSEKSELVGRDSKGRLLWEVGAKKILAYEEKVEDEKTIAPRRAELEDARAILYRDGVAHSTFRAPRIELIYADSGAQLAMTGGVTMKTPGTFAVASVATKPKAKTAAPPKTVSPKAVSPKALTPKSNAKKAAPQLAGDGPIQMTAPRIDIDIEKRQLRALEGAQITQGDRRLTGKTLRADSELAVAQLTSVTATAPDSVMRAQNATWNWKAKRVQASGNVTVKRNDVTLSGALLNADLKGERGQLQPQKGARVLAQSPRGQADAGRLNYDWGKGNIGANGGVNFRKDGAVMHAAQLVSDDKLARAVASGDVNFQKDGGTLRAGQITALDKMTRAVASGGVTLQKDGTTLRAASINAYDNLTRATASGDVTMQRENVTLRAADAEAFIPEKRVVARGGVTVTRPDATLRARTATAWLDSGKVVATAVKLQRRDGTSVTADNAEISGAQDSSTARIVATGDVTASNNRGMVRASKVTWQGAGARGNGRVLASGGVVLQSDGSTLRGDKLEADDAFRSATLTGNVGGTLKGGTKFSAGTLRKTGTRVLASGGVTARNPKATLRADRMDVSADGNNALLSGSVVATTADGISISAPDARYDRAANKIYASGGVVIRDPQRGKQSAPKAVAVLGADNRPTKITLSGGVKGTLKGGLFKNKSGGSLFD